MKIGNVEIPNRFVLAPMAAVNCTAFRMLCKENDAGLVYTQRMDVNILKDKTKKQAKDFLNIQNKERPVSVQLVGGSKKNLIKGMKLIEDFADIIDFNAGCPDMPFMKREAGAHLLSDLEKLEKLVKAMVQNTKKPVTAKIRIGRDGQSINAVKTSQILESAGAKAICVHGRTVQQKYSGKVNWIIMKQIKDKTSIPIIANGDVKSYQEGIEMLEKTNCDLVMIGREARHRPWIFNPKKQELDNEGIRKEILRFISLYKKYEKRQSIQEVGEHVFWMLRDFKTKTNTKVFQKLKTISQIKEVVSALK